MTTSTACVLCGDAMDYISARVNYRVCSRCREAALAQATLGIGPPVDEEPVEVPREA